MKHVWLIGLVAASTLAAQPAPPGTGSIEGHVFNSLTGAPVRKASVSLSGFDVGLAADTDAEGKFQFTALPPGTYRLTANRAGFLNRAARRPVVLSQDGHVTDAEIRLAPQGVISGRVLDEDGDPVAGAYVSVLKPVYRGGSKQWDRIPSLPTNDAGEYRVVNLPPGNYLVEAESAQRIGSSRYGERPMMAYTPGYYPSARSDQAASPVQVAVGADLRGIDVQIFKSPMFHVRGKVTGVPQGQGIGVEVLLTPTGAAGSGANSAAGPPDYTFDALAMPGQYSILADVNSDRGPELCATGSIAISGNVDGVVLSMAPPADVTGRIALAESSARVNLQSMGVSLVRSLSPRYFAFSTVADAAGKLAFPKSLPPGHYMINVNPIPEGCFIQKMTLGGREVTGNEMEIPSSAAIEIILSNTAGKILGSVTDDDGKPVPYASVTLIPSGRDSGFDKGSVDSGGNFSFKGLRPGTYKLFAWEEVDGGVWRDPEFRNKYETRSAEITLGPSETKTAQLHAIRAEEIK